MPEAIEQFLDLLSGVNSWFGIVAGLLALIGITMLLVYLKTDKPGKKTSGIILLNLVKYVIALAALGLILFFVLSMGDESGDKQPDNLRISLFEDSFHLGDDVFSRIGGETIPKWDDPLMRVDEHLIWYDKNDGGYHTHFGFPRAVQVLISLLRPVYGPSNLGAWRHVRAIRPSALKEYPLYKGSYVTIDAFTTLVWSENRGNFYSERAAISWVKTLNLHKEIALVRNQPMDRQIVSLSVVLSGFHGGRRANQEDEVYLYLNDIRKEIHFKTPRPRSLESITIDITDHSDDIMKDINTSFAIAVHTYDEQFPVPPPQWDGDKRGPSHFRDVEFSFGYLHIEYRK